MIEKSGEPAYMQIAKQLREAIQRGDLEPGDSLPSTAKLCDQYEVSASVVKAAISVLRTEGLVIGQQGKGVFVRPARQEQQQAESGDEDELVAQLDQVQVALRDLSGRLAALEAAVFQEQPRTARHGK
ncbi:GntR family transcriptional regulator [Streptomyces sp. NPDC059991]|uniref:GntR family transcriptional regulator n=1 Tax=Streptomyces sp. NPDC059991 TaxID=3347028 RepID=UPI00369D7F6A